MNERAKIEAFEKARQDRREVEAWFDLLNCIDRPTGSRFKVSAAHGVVQLMICGQQSYGSKNYHESPEVLNRVLKEMVAERAKELVVEAIARLKIIEEEARLEARSELEAALAETQKAA